MLINPYNLIERLKKEFNLQSDDKGIEKDAYISSSDVIKIIEDETFDETLIKPVDKYEQVIRKFANDLDLERDHPNSYNISSLLKSADKNLLKDIDTLCELEWKLRNGKAKIVEVNGI